VARGRFFSYALPEGWRVGEEGQYALSLVAPDNQALTVMVGNAGLPPNYPPDRFVQEKLMAMRLQSHRAVSDARRLDHQERGGDRARRAFDTAT
jgi:hypothetical protein